MSWSSPTPSPLRIPWISRGWTPAVRDSHWWITTVFSSQLKKNDDLSAAWRLRWYRNLTTMQETWVPSAGLENLPEKTMATHPNILAWRIPWTEDPSGLQSMGSQRVRYDWVTNTLSTELLINESKRGKKKLVSFSADSIWNMRTSHTGQLKHYIGSWVSEKVHGHSWTHSVPSCQITQGNCGWVFVSLVIISYFLKYKDREE